MLVVGWECVCRVSIVCKLIIGITARHATRALAPFISTDMQEGKGQHESKVSRPFAVSCGSSGPGRTRANRAGVDAET
jgi:hypothetical protein